jgi:hypothetical protein
MQLNERYLQQQGYEMIFTNQGMRIQRIQTGNWDNAIYGMRLPMNSEKQSDSKVENNIFLLGDKDKNLMIRLTKAGTDHAKVLRMIHVSALVKMPFSWWRHFSTYKIGTTVISRSTMHKGVGNVPLTKDDFFLLDPAAFDYKLIDKINNLQDLMINAPTELKREYWNQIIDILPNSYCQQRMIDLNYQVLLNILGSRYQVEKLNEPWDFFCESFLVVCPCLRELYETTKYKRSLTTEEFKKL